MDFNFTDQKFENEYPKLIRDNIPVIYKERTGKEAKTEIIKEDEKFFRYLLKKMVEESEEAEYSIKTGNTLEELADVLEIVDTVLELKGWTWEEVKNMQAEKRLKNGGFEKRLILLEK